MKKFLGAFKVLSPKAKRRMLLLLPLILLGMCLETLSVGMVVPALGILMSESYFDQFPSLYPLLELLGNPTHKHLIFIGLSALAASFFVKNVFIFFQVHYQGTFVYSVQREIAFQLFSRYLSKPYQFHLQTNSSVLIRNLVSEVANFCSFFLMPTLNLVTELFVIVAILALVFWVEPTGTIFLVLVMGLLVILFIRVTNRIVGTWGKKRLEAEEEKLRHLQQGFGGIKEIILSGRKEYFLRGFQLPNIVSGLMLKREYIFQYVPKLGVETIAICSLVGMCLFLISSGKSNEEVTHMLGLMATAGFRMIPSFSRILNNLQSIRYGWASVDILKKEFTDPKFKTGVIPETYLSTNLQFNSLIELKNIDFSYNETKVVLKNVNLTIQKGNMIGISGESGSGKSTIVNLILGLVQPSRGEVLVDGINVQIYNSSNWQRMIGYVPQEVYLLDDTLRRNVAFGLEDSQIDDELVKSTMKMAQIDNLIDSSNEGLNMTLGERGGRLSGGQKQRIGIARALYHNPEILVLDEATSALDSKTEKEILETLKPLVGKKTIIFVAHRDAVLNFCTKIYNVERNEYV